MVFRLALFQFSVFCPISSVCQDAECFGVPECTSGYKSRNGAKIKQ